MSVCEVVTQVLQHLQKIFKNSYFAYLFPIKAFAMMVPPTNLLKLSSGAYYMDLSRKVLKNHELFWSISSLSTQYAQNGRYFELNQFKDSNFLENDIV